MFNKVYGHIYENINVNGIMDEIKDSIIFWNKREKDEEYTLSSFEDLIEYKSLTGGNDEQE